jgi:superfamily I DNA/RNA helicase
MPMKKYDVVFVDEAQDFNQAQRMLILRCLDENARCVIVGDPNQAIYGFRGASSSSMDLFAKLLEKTNREIKTFPLSLTWRCPSSVVAEANRFVEDFHCKDDADEGKVVVDSALNPAKGDMVLCRYNAPLVTAFYKLIG